MKLEESTALKEVEQEQQSCLMIQWRHYLSCQPIVEQSSWHCVGKGTTGGGWRFVLTTVTIPALEIELLCSANGVLSVSVATTHRQRKEVRAGIWSAAMPWGKKWSITGQIYGDRSPAVKPNTKHKISLYCVYCFTVVYVFIVCLHGNAQCYKWL